MTIINTENLNAVFSTILSLPSSVVQTVPSATSSQTFVWRSLVHSNTAHVPHYNYLI